MGEPLLSIKWGKLRRRLKYYAIWSPIWVVIAFFLSPYRIATYIFQLIFLTKDILDILSSKNLAPESFEHLPFSLSMLIIALTVLSDPFLSILSLIDAIIDFSEDIFIEK